MTTTWGATAIPLAAPGTDEAVTDKAATILLAYFKAFLNAYAIDAWQAIYKSTVSPTTPVVGAFINDPSDSEFNERDLPALFLWRTGGTGETGLDDEALAVDWQTTTDKWTLLWIFPPAAQAVQQSRDPIATGLAKLVRMALRRGRAPAYVVTGDSDVGAANHAAAPNALKTAIASASTPQTYSGAALNGSIGAGAITPPRAPTVTISGNLGAFVPGSKVLFTGLNTIGSTVVSTATLGSALGTFAGDYDLASVSSIAVDGQNSTAGTFTFGLAARAGLGSVVLRHAGLVSCVMTAWKARKVTIEIGGDAVGAAVIRRNYDALEVSLTTIEKLEEDLSDTGPLGQTDALAGASVSFRREDTTEIETALYGA